MTALDDLPTVSSFLGIDLKTGSMIIAAIGIFHPLSYGCTFFLPISYLLVTVWILLALYFAASCLLYFGAVHSDALMISIYIWYTLVFVVLMLMLLILLAMVFTSRRQKSRVFIVILGMLWYIMTIYFIVVVNSYRKQIANHTATLSEKLMDKGEGLIKPVESRIFKSVTRKPILNTCSFWNTTN